MIEITDKIALDEAEIAVTFIRASGLQRRTATL
jgi:hypothetical protein